MRICPLVILALASGAVAGGATSQTANGRPDVPPGVSADDPDRSRFRLGQDPLRSFEGDSEGWSTESWPEMIGLGEPAAEEARVSQAHASDGRSSLVLPLDLPRPTVVFKKPSSLGQFCYVTYDVFVPKGAPGRIRSLFFVKDKDGLWFQSLSARPLLRHGDSQLVPGPSPFRLVPGEWNTVTIDLRDGSPDLRPVGSLARWQERFAVASEVLGFAVFGDEPFRGEAYLDNIRGWTLADPPEDRPRALAIRNLLLPDGAVATCARWEATFELTRAFSNPFDPEEIRVDGVFTTPSSEEVRVPGFLYQDYSRRLTPAGEELTPTGPAVWKVRYAPREAGRHSFRLEVAAGPEKLVTRGRGFDVAPSDDPGFVRVSRKDPRCFEFENGEFFYPIGHNLRSPNDPRCSYTLGWPVGDDEGTYTYDRVLRRMAESGENFVEIWMASWWVGLEWTHRWKGYHGLGRYNLANAWRLDYVLRTAKELGLRVQLVIDNHGKYSNWCDQEWADSPYNARNRTPAGLSSGFLSRPDDFFSDEEARRLYRNKTRYLFARWGAETAIAGLEMISELNLVGNRPGFAGRKGGGDDEGAPLRIEHLWHRDMIRYFWTVDTGKHLYTTHYSGDFNSIDPVMARLDELAYVTGDGYRSDNKPFSVLAGATAYSNEQFGKPFMITEYGGDWNATSEAGLEADLHAGLWAGWMTSAGGTPLLWWFDLIEKRGLYWHFKAFAAYARGEDRRDPELRMHKPVVECPGVEDAGAMAFRSPTRGYAWAYAAEPMRRYPVRLPVGRHGLPAGRTGDGAGGFVNPVRVERCRLTFSGVEDGGWRVEFWDTVSGSMSASALVDAWDNKLVVDLPPFDNDLALKLRRTRRLLSAPRPAVSTPASAPPASSESAPQENPDEATTSAPPAERMIPGVRSRLLPPREDAFGLRSKDFILDWAVLGPFSFAPAKFEPPDYSGAAHVAYVPDEAGLRPVDGAIVGGRRWRKYVHARESTIPRQQIDLKAFMGNGFCAAYMAAEIWCDRPMDKVSLLVGCDDYMQVWLNGRLVHTYDTECRSVYIDNDQIDNLRLGKGSNWLVMKIVDVTGGWQAVARFADAHGRPLPVEPMGD